MKTAARAWNVTPYANKLDSDYGWVGAGIYSVADGISADYFIVKQLSLL